LGRSVLREEAWQGNGILSVVFVSDSEIQGLNARFLGKERPTDVIAFPLDDEEDEIWGEIYISVDRAREQAEEYDVTFPEELVRLVIHGILHLLGEEDDTKSDRKKMKEREDHHLSRFFKSHHPNRSMKHLS
jgi:probable rRNA maturation factor